MARFHHPKTAKNPFGAGKPPLPPGEGFSVSVTFRMNQRQASIAERHALKTGQKRTEVLRELLEAGIAAKKLS